MWSWSAHLFIRASISLYSNIGVRTIILHIVGRIPDNTYRAWWQVPCGEGAWGGGWWVSRPSSAGTADRSQEGTAGPKDGSDSSKSILGWILILVVFRVTNHPDLLRTGVGGWFPRTPGFLKPGKSCANWDELVTLDFWFIYY